MKNNIAGKHLWETEAEYLDGVASTASLWITTDSHSATQATTKAKNFLKRHRDRYPRGFVKAIKYVGTIDA